MTTRGKLETPLVRAILDALRSCGVCAWRCNTGGYRARMRGAPNGTPDVLGYLRGGTLLALEVKRPGETRNPDQVAWGERAAAAGVRYAVVHSVSEAVDVATGSTKAA